MTTIIGSNPLKIIAGSLSKIPYTTEILAGAMSGGVPREVVGVSKIANRIIQLKPASVFGKIRTTKIQSSNTLSLIHI